MPLVIKGKALHK